MEEINNLKKQVKILEIQLNDSNKKLILNKQYSATLEEKINTLDNSRPIVNNIPLIVFLVIVIVILCKKVLVLSKCKKCNWICGRFITRWLYAWY